MRLKGLLITLVILLGIVFAVVNWATLNEAVPINLLFATVALPLGLTLLAFAVGLAVLFFVVSLVDRAGQLRQITSLERQNESLRARLETRRLEELEALERRVLDQVAGAQGTVVARIEKTEEGLRQALTEQETRTKERLDEVRERVVMVRNELAADIAEAEDALSRRATPLPDVGEPGE